MSAKAITFFAITLLLSSCTLLRRNSSAISVGDSEAVARRNVKVIEERAIGTHNVLTLRDGVLVTDGQKVVEKLPQSHPYIYEAQVMAASSGPAKNLRYYVDADPRLADSKSLFFQKSKSWLEALMVLKGFIVTPNKELADAVVYLGYAVTTMTSTTLTNNGYAFASAKSYGRTMVIAACKSDKASVNLWEVKVESLGNSNDPSVFVPGLMVAGGLFLGENSNGSEDVRVPDTSVTLNIIVNFDVLKKYFDNSAFAVESSNSQI